MRTLILSILVTGSIIATSVAQIAGVNSLNPLSEKFVVTAEGGATYTFADFRKSSVNFYSRIMGEYFFETKNMGIFGLRVFGSFGYLSGSGGVANYLDPNTRLEIPKFKTSIANIGGGLNYFLAATEYVFPYAYTGVSYLIFDPKDGSGNRLPNNLNNRYSRREVSYQGELGIRFLVDKDISLNFNGSVNYSPSDRLDDVDTGTEDDIFYTFLGGISFYIGGVEDNDKDGVNDEFDACPETPQGVRVDEFGCPIDTDADGVPDYLDRCPNTRSNIIVDVDGCPLDTDFDGVPNYLDECANTMQNIPVDSKGCPFDSDEDGVPDYKDNCPNTPIGTEVDKFGCRLEEQKKELPDITSMVLSGKSTFEIGKSRLLRDAELMLDRLVNVMKKYSDTRWRIEGHTDNTGSYQRNKRLSLERAWSVADYLIDSGIQADRLVVEGLGSDYPIGDNSTISGRTQNRRVTVEMIDTGPGRITEDTHRILDVTSPVYNSTIERNVGNMIFTDGNLYCYQVSSWRQRIKAEQEVNRLTALGANAFITEVTDIRGLRGTWYRVRIGYFNSLQEARNSKAGIIK